MVKILCLPELSRILNLELAYFVFKSIPMLMMTARIKMRLIAMNILWAMKVFCVVSTWVATGTSVIHLNSISWCRLLQLRFCKSYYNVGAKLMLTTPRWLLKRNGIVGKQKIVLIKLHQKRCYKNWHLMVNY